MDYRFLRMTQQQLESLEASSSSVVTSSSQLRGVREVWSGLERFREVWGGLGRFGEV